MRGVADGSHEHGLAGNYHDATTDDRNDEDELYVCLP